MDKRERQYMKLVVDQYPDGCLDCVFAKDKVINKIDDGLSVCQCSITGDVKGEYSYPNMNRGSDCPLISLKDNLSLRIYKGRSYDGEYIRVVGKFNDTEVFDHEENI